MDQQVTPARDDKRSPLSKWEFIALCAFLMSVNALAIDIMLPALQQIGASLGVADENQRQLVVSAYVGGLGVATLFFGPLSDRYGRRAPLFAGLLVYIAAALASAFVESFALLLALRFIQGVGAASTRVIAVSIIRDTFGGRAMAEVMSLVFMVFMAVPIVAPMLGQVIMLASGWHLIFVVMGLSTLVILIWTAIRLPETLHEEYRRPFTLRSTLEGFRVVLTTRISICYTLALTSIFGALFGFINSAQQIYQDIYGVSEWFPVLFAAVAGMMAVSSFLNSRLVGRLGMRRLSHGALLGFIAINALTFALSLVMTLPLWAFTLLYCIAMVQFSWIGANFNSLAMEPLGHIAGTASSVQGFIQTVGSGFVGALIGLSFNGTTMPLAAGYFVTSVVGLLLVLVAEQGRLFRQVSSRTR